LQSLYDWSRKPSTKNEALKKLKGWDWPRRRLARFGNVTYEKFLQIMRQGTDFDTTVHPTCTGAPNVGCVQPPFDGSLLQVMPWPDFRDLTDHETRAVYEY
jgi:hypothetical protein